MRVLYAADGSQGGLAAARFLAGLPHHGDTHVHIMTVLDPEDRGDGSAVLETARAALGEFPGHVTATTGRGRSTSEIVDFLLCTADRANADLIVVGASGHSALTRFFIGSVAESVARYSRHPVLVTRPQTTPLREVIAGIDGSDKAKDASLFAAARFPLPMLCALRLASVVPQPVFPVVPDPLFTGAPDPLALEMANREARKKAAAEAEALADSLRETRAGLRITVEPVALGTPAVELIRIADEHSAGLIVVGSHGLSGIQRFLLGSVSERVLRHAHCSVLIGK